MSDSQIRELDEQILAIEEAHKADPDNGELAPLLKELQQAKKALIEALANSAPPRTPTTTTDRAVVYCSVAVGDKERVGKVIKDEQGVVRVVFLGVNVVKDFPNDQVKYLTGLPSGVFPGAKLEGVYEQDGRWYPCVVVKRLPENRAVVKFDGYKEEVELRLSFLRPRGSEPQEKEYVTPAGYRIPEKLKIEEKDPEKLKAMKKRKIEELKKGQRAGRKDEEAETRKKSWIDFKQSVSNK